MLSSAQNTFENAPLLFPGMRTRDVEKIPETQMRETTKKQDIKVPYL